MKIITWVDKKYLICITLYLILFLIICVSCFFKIDICPKYELLLHSVLIGGLGGFVYCFRAVYLQACVKKEWDENWAVWYFLRPILSLIIGGISYLFIKAGLVVFSSSEKYEINQLSILALAFLSGLNVDNFLKKIESIGETIWGVSPSRVSRDKHYSRGSDE